MTQGPDVLCAEGVREQCSGWAGEITEDFVNPGGANSHCYSLLLHRDSPLPPSPRAEEVSAADFSGEVSIALGSSWRLGAKIPEIAADFLLFQEKVETQSMI